MKKILTLAMISLLLLSTLSILAPQAKADMLSNDPILYAGGHNPGVVYHYLGGTSWEVISPVLGYAVLSLVEYDGHLYAGTTSAFGGSGIGRVYRYDGGTTWTLVGNNMDNDVCSLAIYQGHLYAGTAWNGMKLYRYEGGTSWTQVIGNIVWDGTRSLYVSHGYLLMGDIGWDYIGHWDGVSFYQDQPSTTGSCIYDFQEYGDYLYAAAYTGRLWRSTDATRWSVVLDYYDGNMWELEEFRGQLYTSYNNGELRTSDGTTRGTLVYQASDGIISMTTDGNYLYFGTGGDAVGYGPESSGIANVYKYDGTNVVLISNEDQMGAGVQVLYTPLLITPNPWGDDDNDGILNFLESIAISPYNIQSLGYWSTVTLPIKLSIGTYDFGVGGGYTGFVDPFNTYDEITAWATAHVTATERPSWTAEVGNVVGILFLEISKDLLTTSLSLVPQTYGLLGALATFAPECADKIVRFALLVNVPNPSDINTLLGITGTASASLVSLFLDIWFLDNGPTLPDGFKFTRIPELTLENFVDAIGSTVFGLLLGKIAGMLKGVADIAKTVPKLIKQFFVDVIWANLYEKFIRPGVEFIDIQGRRFYNYIATRIDSAFRDIDLQLYVDGNLVLGGTILASEFGFYSGDTISSEYMLINATDLVNHRIILVINGTEAEMFGEEYDVSVRVMQSGSLVNEQSFTGTIDPGQIFVSSINVSTGPQGELIATLSQPILIITIDSWITDSDFCNITEFRAVFTPDGKTGYYKLTATNPGQFYQNILVNNNGPSPLNITITYDIDPNFTMQGAVPIHIYTDLDRTIDITSNCTFLDNKITTYNVPSGGIVYVTIHLDYALKGTRWTKSQVKAWYSQDTFNATAETDISSIKSSVTITDPETIIPAISTYLVFLMVILPSIMMSIGLLMLLKYASLTKRRRKEK